MSTTMIGENRQLVTNEPVEFEKSPVEVQDCRKINDYFRGIYRIYPNLIKGKPEDVGLANTRSQPVMPKNLPDHWSTTFKKHVDKTTTKDSTVISRSSTHFEPSCWCGLSW